jgi:hypothetical protein
MRDLGNRSLEVAAAQYRPDMLGTNAHHHTNPPHWLADVATMSARQVGQPRASVRCIKHRCLCASRLDVRLLPGYA